MVYSISAICEAVFAFTSLRAHAGFPLPGSTSLTGYLEHYLKPDPHKWRVVFRCQADVLSGNLNTSFSEVSCQVTAMNYESRHPNDGRGCDYKHWYMNALFS